LPSPPFIDAPGLANLRDVGGYEIAGPSHRPPHQMVRRGLLYRSADPSGLTAEGVAVLSDQLGIKTVFDLRSVVELSRDGTPPTPSWDGSASVFVPIFLDKDYSPEALAVRFNNYSDGLEGFVRAYSSILAAAADPGHPHAPFRTIFESLASAPPSPLLVHCTAGKDRTGIFCALVLALCGVDDEAIAHDYSLTDLGLAQLKEATVQKLINGDALRGDRARAERMVSSRKENMLATLATLRATYGSVETYVTAHCGVPAAAVEQVRRNFIVNI
ncbi:protein-tyrosine phosphatase-like protein, partial [Lasiosphaeria miniovina]